MHCEKVKALAATVQVKCATETRFRRTNSFRKILGRVANEEAFLVSPLGTQTTLGVKPAIENDRRSHDGRIVSLCRIG
jgi:hypothetical protein